MTRARRVFVLTALALTMAACVDGAGGDGGFEGATVTFEDDRFGITFEYPDDFRLGDVTDIVRTSGGSATANQGIGIDDDNAIFLSRYDLAAEVTDDNVDDAQAELDGVVSDLVDADVTGERTEVGGLIAFQYDDLAVTPPVDGESDLTFVFDGDVQYQLNCQSTPTHRDRMDEACDLAVDTLEAA